MSRNKHFLIPTVGISHTNLGKITSVYFAEIYLKLQPWE